MELVKDCIVRYIQEAKKVYKEPELIHLGSVKTHTGFPGNGGGGGGNGGGWGGNGGGWGGGSNAS